MADRVARDRVAWRGRAAGPARGAAGDADRAGRDRQDPPGRGLAERLRGRFDAGTVFVPLAAVVQPDLVLGGIARAVGTELGGSYAPLQVLAERLGDGHWLLIRDNLEQVIQVVGDLDELLARCPGVVVVATSRTVLGLRGASSGRGARGQGSGFRRAELPEQVQRGARRTRRRRGDRRPPGRRRACRGSGSPTAAA
jgi:hypothetical protein